MQQEIDAPPTDAQSLDTIYGLLSNHRRRDVIIAISEQESPISIDKLASRITENEREAEDSQSTPIENVVAALHHVHLPKLDDAGVIDYDAEANVVIPARTEALTPFIQPIHEFE